MRFENGPGEEAGQGDRSASGFDHVDPRILWSFPDLVAGMGGDPAMLFRQSGLDPDAARDGRVSVSYRQMVDLVARAAELLNCPDFGMRLASLQVRVIQSPLMGILRHSRTLGEAWQFVTRHSYAHSLAAAIWLKRSPADEIVMLGHDILLEGLADRRQAIEQILLVIHLSCRESTSGMAQARRVDFRHQPLSSAAVYRRYFGCAVRFGQPADMIVYGEDALACPIAVPDPDACSRIIEEIGAAFPQRKPPLHVTVRGLVIHLLGSERCSNDGVANVLSLHPRTLHRRLREESTSFQRIKNEVRRDMLIPYLDQTDLPISEISERLGFAEQSAMTRFCRQSLGQSPTQRRSQAERHRRFS